MSHKQPSGGWLEFGDRLASLTGNRLRVDVEAYCEFSLALDEDLEKRIHSLKKQMKKKIDAASHPKEHGTK